MHYLWLLALLLGLGCGGDSTDTPPANDVTNDVGSDTISADVASDAAIKDSLGTLTDAASDIAQDIAPDIASDIAPDVAQDVTGDAATDIPLDVSPEIMPGDGGSPPSEPKPPRREALFAAFRFVNGEGDTATTKFTNFIYPHAHHNLGNQARTTLAPGHSVDANYVANGVSWYLPADVSFGDFYWPLEARNTLYHLATPSAHIDSLLTSENDYILDPVDERSQTFTHNNLTGLQEIFRYVDNNQNHSLRSPLELADPNAPEFTQDGGSLGFGYPRYGKVDHTNIESVLVTATHQIGASERFVSLSSNPIGGGAVWDIVYTDENGQDTGFVNHLDFGRGLQTTLVYLFDEDETYNDFERAWLATEGGGQMWASVGHFDMNPSTLCSGTNTTQDCFDNIFGSPCVQIENIGQTQVTAAIPLEYFPWMHEFTPPEGIRPGHWPTYPVNGQTYTSKVPNGGGGGPDQEAVVYPPAPEDLAITWNAGVFLPPPNVAPEPPRGLIIFPDDRIGKTADFSLFYPTDMEEGRPIIKYTVRITTSATNIPATLSVPALFLKGSLRHWVEFYDPGPEGMVNSQVLSSPDNLATGRFDARQPNFGGSPDLFTSHMAYILSESGAPNSPAIAFYAVTESAGGPLHSVGIAFNSDSDPTGVVRDDPYTSKHIHVQPGATHIKYSVSGTTHNGGNLHPGTYEWTTFIIVDELQHIKGHIDWLYSQEITGGSYQFLPAPD